MFSFHTVSRLKCLEIYTWRSFGPPSEKLKALQKEIAVDEDLMKREDYKQLDKVSEETRKIVLKVLQNYAKQWQQAEKIAQITAKTADRDFCTAADIHDRLVTQAYIALLIATITTYKFGPERSDAGDAFILALSQNERLPDSGTRKSHDQTKWKKNIEERYEIHKNAPENYNLEHKFIRKDCKCNCTCPTTEQIKTNTVKLAWCPVLKDFIPKEKGSAAHIVPHSLGYELAKKIFAHDEIGKDLAFSPRNGLWMTKKVEAAFDDAQVIIVPVDTKNIDTTTEQYDLKLVVLDKTLLGAEKKDNMILNFKQGNGEGKKYYWHQVDGTTLNFREAKARPARRYLFFHYLYTAMRLSTQKPDEYAERLGTLTAMGGNWATPGSYFEKGLMDMLSTKLQLQPSFSNEPSIENAGTSADAECMAIAKNVALLQDEILEVQEGPGIDSESEEGELEDLTS